LQVNKILNLAHGTAQPNISTKDIEELQIPVPSLETQQQIISQYEEKMKSIDEIKNKILNVENIILECNAQQKLLFYI
jgi:restriction endonuclease S subunit